MHRPPTRFRFALATAATLTAFALFTHAHALAAQPRISITRSGAIPAALDGRLLLYLSTDTTGTPRSRVNGSSPRAQSPNERSAIAKIRSGSTSPATISTALFGR